MYNLNNTETELIKYYRHTLNDENFQDIHVLGSGFVKELENKLSDYYKHKHSLCVSNATTGLLGIWLSLGINPGDNIITSPLSFPATIAGLLLLSANPYFVDIEPDTLCINPRKVEKLLKINRKFKAVLSVDYYGIPADTLSLKEITEKYNIPLISDSAQSFGSIREKKPGGYFADVIVISFGHHKCNFAGEGGVILTNSNEIYEKLIWNLTHPELQKIKIGRCNEFALNARISPFSAIIANANFEKSLSDLKTKQEKCFKIIDLMNESKLIEPIHFKSRDIEPSFYRLSGSWKKREKSMILYQFLSERGYQVNIYKDEINPLYRSKLPTLLNSINTNNFKSLFHETENQIRKRFIVSI